MGQRIEIESARVVDDAVIFTMNRSLTSQDGEGYGSGDEAAASHTFGGNLASELFESDESITRVYVASNVVVATRSGGWSDDSTHATERVVQDFFLFYPAA